MKILETNTSELLKSYPKTAIVLPDGQVVQEGHTFLSHLLTKRGVDRQFHSKIIYQLLGLQHRNEKAIDEILEEHAKSKKNTSHVGNVKKHKADFSQIMGLVKDEFSNLCELGPDQLIKSRFGLEKNRFSFLAFPHFAAYYTTSQRGGEGMGPTILKKHGYDSKQVSSIFLATGKLYKNIGYDRFSKQSFNKSIDFETRWKDFDKLLGVDENTKLVRNTDKVAEYHSGTRELWEVTSTEPTDKWEHAKRARARLAHELTPHQKHHFDIGKTTPSVIQLLVMSANHIVKGEKNPDIAGLYNADPIICQMYENTKEHLYAASTSSDKYKELRDKYFEDQALEV